MGLRFASNPRSEAPLSRVAARFHPTDQPGGDGSELAQLLTVEVATTLAAQGGVTDPTTLVAAILHDTIEDTPTHAALGS
jgi:(p)ppGpp synthase/HD superfamily hydrolase